VIGEWLLDLPIWARRDLVTWKIQLAVHALRRAASVLSCANHADLHTFVRETEHV
jgi:hypothetical protein